MNSKIHEDCVNRFKKLKFQKDSRFITYKVDAEKVVIETIGEREKNWDTFKASLPEKEPRMSVFDLEYHNSDGMNCSKLFFCYWLPNGTPIKQKLTYASFKESFKSQLDIGGKEIIINSIDEYPLDELIKEFGK